MHLINIPDQNLALQAFIQDQVQSPQTFNSVISDQDEMYLFALANQGNPDRACLRYYFNGRRILDAVLQVLNCHFSDLTKISSFLDFASGYGRFIRFLIQEIPPEKIWISDIYTDAVQFQMEQFKVRGIVSTTYPDDYVIDQQFDCILACSFFSHLPEKTFFSWMQKLYSLLSPQGILLFSVHDRALLPEHLMISPSELLFIPDSESRTLDVNEYGTTYVGEEFVKNVLQTVSQGEAFYSRISKGICRYQDLYCVTRNPQPHLASVKFSHHPQGRLEQYKLTEEGTLLLKGWVSEINPDSQLEGILIFVNGECIDNALSAPQPSHPEQQFSWSYQLSLNNLSKQDVILIKAVNSQGLEWVFEAATLEHLIKYCQGG